MKDKLTITDAAMLLHKNNRVFCAILGDDSHANWGNLDEGLRKSVISGVENFLANPNITPEQSHQAWLDHKQANGWTLGAKKDIAKKTHPNMVPFDKLPEVEKAKDQIFTGLLKAIAPLIEIPKPKEETPAAPATEAAPAPEKK